MEDRFKELTTKLVHELKVRTVFFMQENLQEEEEVGDVLNLILSTYISSLFSLMYEVSYKFPKTHAGVIQFMDEMRKFIQNNILIGSLDELSMEH